MAVFVPFFQFASHTVTPVHYTVTPSPSHSHLVTAMSMLTLRSKGAVVKKNVFISDAAFTVYTKKCQTPKTNLKQNIPSNIRHAKFLSSYHLMTSMANNTNSMK